MSRRLLAALSTLLVTGVGLAPPATADSTQVVRGLPNQDGTSTWQIFGVGCEDPGTHPADNVMLKIERSSDPTPTGTHNWGVQSEGVLAVGPIAYTPYPTTSEWNMRVDSRNGGTSGWAVAYYWTDSMPMDQFYLGQAPLSVTSSGWHTLDLKSTLLQWHLYSQATGYGLAEATATLSDFAKAKGGDGSPETGSGAWIGYALGCDSSPGAVEPWYFDAMRVGTPGDVTTYDFEATLTAALISASKAKVVKGGKVALKGWPDPNVSRFSELEMVLQAKPSGADRFRTIGRATYRNVDGVDRPAKLTVTPKRTTKYRWRIPAGSSYLGSTSRSVTVKVVAGSSPADMGPGVSGGGETSVGGGTLILSPRLVDPSTLKR